MFEGHRVVGLLQNDPLRVSYEDAFQGERTFDTNKSPFEYLPSHSHNQGIVNGIPRIGFMTGGTAAIWKDEEMEDVSRIRPSLLLSAKRISRFFSILHLTIYTCPAYQISVSSAKQL